MWMKRWSNSTRVGHAAIPDSRRPDIRIGRGPVAILGFGMLITRRIAVENRALGRL